MLKSFARCLLPLILFMAVNLAVAADSLVWSGFATQGLTYTSDNNIFGESDDSIATDFSEVGLNANYLTGGRLRFAGQVAYRNSNELDEHRYALDMLLLEYQIANLEKLDIYGQIGRIKLNFGLYGNVIDVAAGWPMALMPEVFYTNRYRMPMLKADGVNLLTDWQVGSWNGRAEFILGQLDIEGSLVNDTWFYSLAEVESDTTDRFIYSRVSLSNEDGSLTLGGSVATVDWDLNANLSGYANSSGDVGLDMYFLFLSKAMGNWQLDLELSRWEFDVDNLQFSFDPSCDLVCLGVINAAADLFVGNSAFESGYVSLYRYWPNGMSAYVGGGIKHEDDRDPYGKHYEATTGLPGYKRYLVQYFIGFKYDIDSQWSLAGSVNYFEGGHNLISVINPDYEHNPKYWHAAHLNLSYRF